MFYNEYVYKIIEDRQLITFMSSTKFQQVLNDSDRSCDKTKFRSEAR